MSLRGRILRHLSRRLGDQPPSLRLAFWDGEAFDFAPHPTVTVTLNSPRVARMMLTGNMSRLGDAYVSGELTVAGSVEDVLGVGMALADRLGRSPWTARLARLLAQVSRHHSRRKDAAAIRQHYDVSNEFFALWLDRNMVYSCAYFRTGAEDLDTAQEQKLDHLCRKLRLEPGQHLLDVGCGFAGLLRWAARHYGVTGVGVTLSKLQHAYARERVHRDGLAGQIEIRHQDYRDIPGEAEFDKAVSVGMFEHVGLANLPLYFATVCRLLKPGGAMLNHGIILTDPDGHAQGPIGGEFIERHVFPGGELAALPRVLYEMARSGLETVDIEDLRPHYARTLQHWVRRLEAHEEQALRLAGPERYRIWRMYMAGMAHAFDRGWLSIAQVLAYKPNRQGMARRPWTRDYQYARIDDRLAIAENLDWRNP